VAVDAIANSTTNIPSTTIDRSTNPAPVTTNSAASTDAKDATLNYDSFLKLLVAQMKNQDPTDPVDASEQMSQLASFSNVEQAIKTNKNLESLIKETSMSQAADLIGKHITSADGATKGIVKAVEINSDGLTAVLENGKEVLVSTGVTIASASTTTSDPDTDPDTDTPDDGETDSVSGE
jgi:flagellar basal-body rod modification protein FlgD